MPGGVSITKAKELGKGGEGWGGVVGESSILERVTREGLTEKGICDLVAEGEAGLEKRSTGGGSS